MPAHELKRIASLAGLLLLLALASSGPAAGDLGLLELTPLVGFHRAGGITVEERAFQQEDFHIDVSSGGTVGLILDVGVTHGLKLELLLNRQVGAFEDRQALFGEEPGGFFEPGQRDHLDVEIIHYHGGLLWEFGRHWARPFLSAGAGITRIDPSLPPPLETCFSFSVGGGFKMDLSSRLGLRLEGRYYRADTDEEVSVEKQFVHRDCEGSCTYTYCYEPDFTQGEVSLGLIIRL